jgi:PilZ domain
MAAPLELLTTCGGMDKAGAADADRQERRKRVRTQVHWTILLFRETTSKAVATITQNLSSSGFYCLSRSPFSLGEQLFCSLEVPTHDPLDKGRTAPLECRARVVRVEPERGNGRFGIACQIEDYHFAV